MRFLVAVCFVLTSATMSRGDILITELHPTGSSNSTYQEDWFELTNMGASAVDITGWSWDDDSDGASSTFAFSGITSIASGESVVFIKGTASTSGVAFIDDWFGGNAPAGFQLGFHDGPGLSGSNGDAVNIFDSTNALVARLEYPAFNIPVGTTLDNAARIINGSTSTLSVAGVNGAFVSGSGQIGSPGAIPEPSTMSFLGLAGLGLLLRRRNA